MSVQVNVYEAKTRLSQLLDQAVGGEDVIIARNGTPVARLVPVQRPSVRRQPGTMRGKIWMAPDFDETSDELAELFLAGDPADPK
jgi:prevent-host-death family protein